MHLYTGICAYVKRPSNGEQAMPLDSELKAERCNCLAIREAARRVSQFYDRFLAPIGLRTTQFSILAKLSRWGPLTINALAKSLVMDRTTLGRNILPLEREGLIAVSKGSTDRRSKELRLTEAGAARFKAGGKGWHQAQAQFETAFGVERSAALRALLCSIAASDIGAASSTGLARQD
jgi:DNA-binding MarR family transcriptional regulator